MISTTELKRLTGAAKAIAISAGQILLKKSKKRHRVMLKGRVDLVTDADLASEKYIVGEITKKFPNHSILAERKPPGIITPITGGLSILLTGPPTSPMIFRFTVSP